MVGRQRRRERSDKLFFVISFRFIDEKELFMFVLSFCRESLFSYHFLTCSCSVDVYLLFIIEMSKFMF
jgi:hypothetical protein